MGTTGETAVEREPNARLDGLAREVIGAAIEVHRHLGPGFLETVYQAALQVELSLRGIAFRPEYPIEVGYKGHRVGEGRADLRIDQLIVELKAVDKLLPIHEAQVISYLKATGCELALLINFNEEVLRRGLRRIVLTQSRRAAGQQGASE